MRSDELPVPVLDHVKPPISSNVKPPASSSTGSEPLRGLRRYKMINLVGDGTYGLVYLAYNQVMNKSKNDLRQTVTN